MVSATVPSTCSRVASEPARESAYRVCTRCIMDTSDPEIQFDAKGHCNHCRRYDERARNEIFTGEAAKERLAQIVETIQRSGRNREYDCVIGVSGGVDSTAVAYYVKELGLRPLAVHLDNGWNSELAVDNIKKTLQTLDIDLFTYVIDWEEFRDLQVAFLKSSVPNCEIPTDHAINALLVKTALAHRVRYVMLGGNVATEGIMPSAWCYYSHDLRHLNAIQKRFGTRKLRSLPRLSLPGYLYSFLVRGVRFIPILNYLDYNKAKAKQLIQSKLGWRDYGGKHFESIYTRFYQAHILPTKFGFDKRRPHLSTLVCSGEMTREAALAELAKDPYGSFNLAQDEEFVIKKLRLTKEEFKAIMAAPPLTHYDFPSNALFFHKLPKLKTLFKKIATRA